MLYLSALSEVLYGGEALPLEQPRSFVCPHCGRMGFTETSLADHVSAQHADSVTQVVSQVGRGEGRERLGRES